jgi:hypothetical protein
MIDLPPFGIVLTVTVQQEDASWREVAQIIASEDELMAGIALPPCIKTPKNIQIEWVE